MSPQECKIARCIKNQIEMRPISGIEWRSLCHSSTCLACLKVPGDPGHTAVSPVLCVGTLLCSSRVRHYPWENSAPRKPHLTDRRNKFKSSVITISCICSPPKPCSRHHPILSSQQVNVFCPLLSPCYRMRTRRLREVEDWAKVRPAGDGRNWNTRLLLFNFKALAFSSGSWWGLAPSSSQDSCLLSDRSFLENRNP